MNKSVLTSYLTCTSTSHLVCRQLYVSMSGIESLEGTVFDQLIELYDHFKNELLSNVIRYVVADVRARSRVYCNDK